MTVHHSECGLAYTAASQELVTDFETAITSYLATQTDTMALLDAILKTDADMLMAICFRGYLLKLAAHPQFAITISDCIARAHHLVEEFDSTEREQAHVQALDLWCHDRADAALAILEANLKDNPLDMLALRIAHYLHFYTGRGESMRDSTARVLKAWHPDHPQYGYLLGMHAFGLEESGEYEDAFAHGCEAVLRNNGDLWAIHAVAHVHQMQHQHEDGIRWLEDTGADWRHTNNFRYHVIWHEALHWLGLQAPERALSIYDESLAASLADDFYLDVCNNASLLWRLEFAGVEVGERWRALADIAASHVDDHELVFASLHYLIPLVVTQSSHAPRLVATLAAWAESGTDQGRVCTEVGLGLADAILQSSAAPAAAAQLLVQHQPATYLIGGSHAQRDLFQLLATESARHEHGSDHA